MPGRIGQFTAPSGLFNLTSKRLPKPGRISQFTAPSGAFEFDQLEVI